ncbi:MAG TPA: HNH endonuclease [Balneolaceae bacterium]|nr:HNH endonuclease [Balneolaceae bacterium]
MAEEVIRHIKNLRTDRNSSLWDERTRGRAPHKPFLLLSVLDGIEIGWINDSQIILNQDLIETFFHYWNNVMGKERNTTIALPFFHMKSEPFWELRYKRGMKPYKNSPSLGGLMNRLSCAQINKKLFEILSGVEGRKIFLRTLLKNYFSEEVQEHVLNLHNINIGAYNYAQQLELIAAEPFVKYHAGNEEDFYTWQKTQQREQGFGLTIREHYDHRCAVCRTKVKTPNGASLVEGAHIIPWSESKNDDPRNGLALCKTHHWMFDHNLLAVQPNYQIKLSAWLKNKGERVEDTLAWDREKILLPDISRYLPNIEALEERYEQFKTAS